MKEERSSTKENSTKWRIQAVTNQQNGEFNLSRMPGLGK